VTDPHASCDARYVVLGVSVGEPCGQPVTHRVRLGCVHEHVVDEAYCARHTEEATAGYGYCEPYLSESRHLCPLRVGAVTVLGVRAGLGFWPWCSSRCVVQSRRCGYRSARWRRRSW
jgi:hypothetical protein